MLCTLTLGAMTNRKAAGIAAPKTEETRGSTGTDSRSPDDPEYFPFSITAGVEKGHKNRCVDHSVRF